MQYVAVKYDNFKLGGINKFEIASPRRIHDAKAGHTIETLLLVLPAQPGQPCAYVSI